MRILPHVFIRAADARPFELQDLLPADTRFKILIFAGDTTLPAQKSRLEKLAEDIVGDEHGFLRKFGKGEGSDELWSDGKGLGRDVFDVLVIGSAKKDKVNYTDIPEVFRSHWSKYVCLSSFHSLLHSLFL